MGILAVFLVALLVVAVLSGATLFGWLPKRAGAVLVVLVILLLGLFLLVRTSDFMKVDRCLDSGGRWNEETESCEY